MKMIAEIIFDWFARPDMSAGEINFKKTILTNPKQRKIR